MKPVQLLASSLCFFAGIGTLLAAPLKVLAWDEGVAARKLSLSTAKGDLEINDLHPLQRSKSYAGAAPDAPLKVVARDRLDAEQKPVTLPVTVPAEMKQPLLLLMPDPKAPSGLRPFVLEDDNTSFPWGTIRLINATGKKLIFQCEKTAKAVPATFTPLDIAPGGDSRNIGIRVALESAPAKALYSAVWEHRADLRNLVFIIPGDDPRQGPVAFKIVPESKTAAAEEKAATDKANARTGNKP